MRLAVAAVVDVRGQVLVLLRRDTTGPVMWELPHTAVAGDESIKDALSRAVREQTGLRISRVTHDLGPQDVTTPRGVTVRWHTFSVSVMGIDPVNAVNLGEQFRHYAWISETDPQAFRPEVYARIVRHFCATRS
jgi:8-oxo-dGTP diphosphatase